MLLLGLGVSLPLLGGTQLSDKIKTLLLAFEHHVLLGTTSEQSLEQDNGSHLLVFLLPLFLVFLISQLAFGVTDFSVLGRVRSERQFVFLFLLVRLLFSSLLVSGLLNEGVGLFEGGLMIAIFPRQLLAELEAHFINADQRVEHFRLLDLEDIVQLFETLV